MNSLKCPDLILLSCVIVMEVGQSEAETWAQPFGSLVPAERVGKKEKGYTE